MVYSHLPEDLAGDWISIGCHVCNFVQFVGFGDLHYSQSLNSQSTKFPFLLCKFVYLLGPKSAYLTWIPTDCRPVSQTFNWNNGGRVRRSENTSDTVSKESENTFPWITKRAPHDKWGKRRVHYLPAQGQRKENLMNCRGKSTGCKQIVGVFFVSFKCRFDWFVWCFGRTNSFDWINLWRRGRLFLSQFLNVNWQNKSFTGYT